MLSHKAVPNVNQLTAIFRLMEAVGARLQALTAHRREQPAAGIRVCMRDDAAFAYMLFTEE